MFDNLVESSAVKKKSSRGTFFLATSVIWIALLTGAIVYGVYDFYAKLNEQFEQLTLLAPPPPRKEEPKPEPPKVVRKSGGVLTGSATRRVEPTYPPLAKAARVSGAVVVEVTIDEAGN